MKLERYFVFIGLALFIYILSKLDLNQVYLVIKDLNLTYLMISILFLPFIVLLRGLKWHFIIKAMKMHLPLHQCCFGYLVGSSFGALTPGKLGNFFRVKILNDTTKAPTAKSLASLVLDNFFDVLNLLMFSVVSIFLFLIFFQKSKYPPLYIFLFIAICLFIYYIVVGKIMIKIKPLIKFFINLVIPQKFKAKVHLGVDGFFREIKKADRKLLYTAFFIDIMSFLVSILCSYFIGLSMGIKASFIAILIFLSISSFVAMLPISISGLGTREATLIFLMSFIGVRPETAVSFSLLTTMMITWLFAIIGSFVLLRYKRVFKIQENQSKNAKYLKPKNKRDIKKNGA